MFKHGEEDISGYLSTRVAKVVAVAAEKMKKQCNVISRIHPVFLSFGNAG